MKISLFHTVPFQPCVDTDAPSRSDSPLDDLDAALAALGVVVSFDGPSGHGHLDEVESLDDDLFHGVMSLGGSRRSSCLAA